MDSITRLKNVGLQICAYAIPISLALYYYIPRSRPILFIHMLVLGIIGNIEMYNSVMFPLWWEKMIGYFFHTILIVILFAMKTTKYINIYSVLLNLFVPIVIYLHPCWPYSNKKNDMIGIYLQFYIIIALLILLFSKSLSTNI